MEHFVRCAAGNDDNILRSDYYFYVIVFVFNEG